MLFNPNHAFINDLPIDVLGQLTRPEGPAYSRAQMVTLVDNRGANGQGGNGRAAATASR